jgi:hypothetical protein
MQTSPPTFMSTLVDGFELVLFATFQSALNECVNALWSKDSFRPRTSSGLETTKKIVFEPPEPCTSRPTISR